MLDYTWSDFYKLSVKEKKQFLNDMKKIAQYKQGIDKEMYNRFADELNMEKI